MKRTLVILLLSTGTALIVGGVFWNYRNNLISGTIVSVSTGLPVPNAIVVVQSGMSAGETSPEPIYLKTDQDGRFIARLYDSNVSIRVWKKGYAENGITDEDRPLRSNIIIGLRELSASNWIPEHDQFCDFASSKGFSFSEARTVSVTSPVADIILIPDEQDLSKVFIQAVGNGGIRFQPYAKNADFYNTPEAPENGYTMRLPLGMSQDGLYFLRTRDGKQYGKFRLLPSVVTTSTGTQSIDWANTRMIWAYQPDGTRNLEIMRSSIPYPFSELASHD